LLPHAERTRAGLAAEQLEDLGGRQPRSAPRPSGPSRARAPRPEKARTERTRNRTRGGKPVSESEGGEATAKSPDERDAAQRRRRRRRRPSGGSSDRPASE
jgi:hypothetical protein